MTPSIIQPESDHECYFCLTTKRLFTHHCLHGTSNRKKADKDGLTVKLCLMCHTALHDHGTGDYQLMKLAQVKWMKHYGKTEKDFIDRYGKSYLHIGEPYGT